MAGGGNFDARKIVISDDLRFVGDLEAAYGSAINGVGKLEVFFVGMRLRLGSVPPTVGPAVSVRIFMGLQRLMTGTANRTNDNISKKEI